MAGNVRVVLKSVWDDKGVKAATKSLDIASKTISTSFKAVGIAAAASAVAIGKIALDSAKAASDLQESTNAVNVAFGAASESILKIGESSAESLGLARTEFNAAAVRFSAFAERIVGQGGDVAGFIGDITTRAADFASVFNIDVSEALRVFQSGLSGEAEPLKRFGINLLESEVKAYAMANGIGEVGRELTETEKVQARYGLLLQSTAKTQGDFANTSDGLANRQRILQASFTDIQAEIGTALLPALESILAVVQEDLLPVFKNVAERVGPAVADAIEFIAEVFGEAFKEGTDLNDALGGLSDAFELLFGAITNGERDAEGFADFLANLVRIVEFLVTTLASLIAGFQGVGYAIDAAKRGDWGEVWRFLTTDTIEFADSLAVVQSALDDTAGEVNRFNNLSLANIRTEMGATAEVGAKLVDQQKQLYFAMKGITDPDAMTLTPKTTTTTTKTSTGPSAFERTQDIIKNAQKQFRDAAKRYRSAVGDAQERYDKAIVNAEKRYSESLTDAEISRDRSLADALKDHNENIAGIQASFAKKQADIITDSINRLRDAYKSAVRTNVADLFGTEAVGQSVTNLIGALKDKLTSSRRLVENASQLAADGFSQTFIEEIVSAGTETGNELASAIMEATPEARRELRDLFNALEQEGNYGMDALSQTIYDKSGLATDQLKALYEQTGKDLTTALTQAEADYVEAQAGILQTFDEAFASAGKTRDEAFVAAQEQLTESLQNAAEAYYESLTDIEEAFREKIASMKGELGGLERTVQQLLAALDSAKQKSSQTVAPAITSPLPGGGSLTVAPLPLVSQSTSTQIKTQAKPTTVINMNVKTDQTQSTAQVGKIIAKSINKYTNIGGVVIGGTGSRYIV